MQIKCGRINDHMFSIELKSKEYLKSMALQNINGENVLIEGFLGKLETIEFTEGILFEINGSKGILRMDLSKKEWNALRTQKMNRLINSDKESFSKQGKGGEKE